MSASNPNYRALAERSRSLALLWSFGHGLLVLVFLAIIGGPLAIFLITRIDPDITRERAITAFEASLAAGVLFLVISVALKRYAMKRGGISVSRRA